MALRQDAGSKIVRDVFLAFVRVHVLHHAAEGSVFGAEMMEELRRHGYDISPGTLYPMLHALEGGGLLASTAEVVNGKGRRNYRTTKAGDTLLRKLRAKIGELFDEVLDGQSRAGRWQ
jgi:DNA-binding PadR family transcriptional regulator